MNRRDLLKRLVALPLAAKMPVPVAAADTLTEFHYLGRGCAVEIHGKEAVLDIDGKEIGRVLAERINDILVSDLRRLKVL